LIDECGQAIHLMGPIKTPTSEGGCTLSCLGELARFVEE
jgi:hypothetical protein